MILRIFGFISRQSAGDVVCGIYAWLCDIGLTTGQQDVSSVRRDAPPLIPHNRPKLRLYSIHVYRPDPD